MNLPQQYIIFSVGTHPVELAKRNHLDVVAVLDYRNNGGLAKAGVNELTSTVHPVGSEGRTPLLSIPGNIRYYKKLSKILNRYPDATVIISSNYTPVNRFIIDHVGPERIELWEDGMNHYIGLEQLGAAYYFKAFAKLLSGYYPHHLFDNQYRSAQLTVKDRFNKKNIAYDRIRIDGGDSYYIGQPLIEDKLISERALQQGLSTLLTDLGNPEIYYLPHPRETPRRWLSELFTILDIDCSAEKHLIQHGSGAVYSAFSTVNMNISCKKNIYLCKLLGLEKIHAKLKQCNFDIEFM